jgi:methylase of polypeptide subunit release factors
MPDCRGREEFQAQSGQCVWPASSMLCFYLRGELERSKPRTVVELGCGVGVPGIFVAKQFPDTRVLLTDASPPLLETTKKNLTVNGVSSGRVRPMWKVVNGL